MELSANGETIDTLWDEAGLRYFHIDREKGFFLNGRPYPLRGVSAIRIGRPSATR